MRGQEELIKWKGKCIASSAWPYLALDGLRGVQTLCFTTLWRFKTLRNVSKHRILRAFRVFENSRKRKNRVFYEHLGPRELPKTSTNGSKRRILRAFGVFKNTTFSGVSQFVKTQNNVFYKVPVLRELPKTSINVNKQRILRAFRVFKSLDNAKTTYFTSFPGLVSFPSFLKAFGCTCASNKFRNTSKTSYFTAF